MTKEAMRALQVEAVVETAYALHRRKEAIQYESKELTPLHKDFGGPFRRTDGFAAEQATQDHYCYSVCSSFFYSLLWDTFRYEFCGSSMDHTCYDAKNYYEKNIVCRWKRGDETGQKAAFRKVLEVMQPGDALVYDHKNSLRHIMLCLPGEKLMHCNGAAFDFVAGKESWETDGAIRLTTYQDFLLNMLGEYPFWHYDEVCVLRYLDDIDPEKYPLTPQALSRLKYKGLDIDRRADRRACQTVAPGETITYTLRLTNSNPRLRYDCPETYRYGIVSDMAFENLEVEEVIPEGTELVVSSLTNDAKLENGKLLWTLDLGVEQVKTLQYTVRVKDDVPCGSYIVSGGGRVDNIPSNEIKILVGVGVSQEDWQKLQALSQEGALADAKIQGDGIAQWVYDTVLGKSVTISTAKQIMDAQYETYDYPISTKQYACWKWEGETVDENGNPRVVNFTMLREKEHVTEQDKAVCAHMVPTMVGGKSLLCVDRFHRMLEFRSEYLRPGDVVAAVQNLKGDACQTEQYLCLGGGKCVYSTPNGFEVMALPNMEEKMFLSSYFAVLRPTMWEK